jgi:dethiobiotin synthetase
VRLEFAHLLREVEARLDAWSDESDVLVVEGVGGLLCPLAENATVADLALALDFPLLVVARRALGTLNHTLLTLEAAAARGLRVAGIVLNGCQPCLDPVVESTNAEELSRFAGNVPILAELPFREPGADWPPAFLGLNWFGLAASSRRGDESATTMG